jgi:hypothetical protein
MPLFGLRILLSTAFVPFIYLSTCSPAPAMSAGFAAVVYLLVKFVVMKSKNPTRIGLWTGPFWFFLVSSVCTMAISEQKPSSSFLQ